MATLKDEALAYEPTTTKNIADLERVPTNLKVKDGVGTDKEGKTFTYKYVEFNTTQYRIPGKVLGDIKAILVVKPTLMNVKVIKKGQGLNTQYTVIPLDQVTIPTTPPIPCGHHVNCPIHTHMTDIIARIAELNNLEKPTMGYSGAVLKGIGEMLAHIKSSGADLGESYLIDKKKLAEVEDALA